MISDLIQLSTVFFSSVLLLLLLFFGGDFLGHWVLRIIMFSFVVFDVFSPQVVLFWPLGDVFIFLDSLSRSRSKKYALVDLQWY